jgi:predicted acyltransferase
MATAMKVMRARLQAVAPEARAPAVEPLARRERLRSLDVFRGLTIAGMILVNSPGLPLYVYRPLEHAPWRGWTFADLVFPFFLFIIGITTEYSLGSRRAAGAPDGDLVRHILKRGAILFAIGLIGSAFPTYDLATMKVTGVLQRIGVVYIIVGLMIMRTSLAQQLAVLGGLLLGYWALLTVVPVPGHGGTIGYFLLGHPADNMAAVLDRYLLGAHIPPDEPIDPEGVVSTIPSIATMLFGVLAGRWLLRTDLSRERRAAGLFVVGNIAVLVGIAWGTVFQVNKHLWTSSFAVLTAGLAAVWLAVSLLVIDVFRSAWWVRPFEVFGLNPLAAYIGSEIVDNFAEDIHVVHGSAHESVKQLVMDTLFSRIADPYFASMLYAVAFVLLWLAIMWVLWRKKIVIKI